MLSDHGGKAYSEYTGYPSALQELKTVVFESVITCPHCSTAKSETMRTPAGFFMNALAVVRSCGRKRVIAACSAPTALCPVRRWRELARTTGVGISPERSVPRQDAASLG